MIPKIYVGVKIRCVFILALTLVFASSAANAITITDKLDSSRLMSSHSDGITFDDTAPEFFFDDAGRVKNQAGSVTGNFSCITISVSTRLRPMRTTISTRARSRSTPRQTTSTGSRSPSLPLPSRSRLQGLPVHPHE